MSYRSHSKRDASSSDDDDIAACENIHKTYLLGVEGVPALRGVSVSVTRGDFVVVYGTSGGGKSTLLNVLGTIDVPTKGNLLLLGHRITDRTPDAELARLRCHHVGFVFQSFNLLSTMTALDNVSLPMIIAGKRSRAKIRQRAEKLLRAVGLGHRMEHFPSMMSGGEQQRVTIARSLANKPELLLLDEPTGDLDSKNTHIVMKILLDLNNNTSVMNDSDSDGEEGGSSTTGTNDSQQELQRVGASKSKKGLTMVMVSHDVYMKQYADKVLYLRDGKVANMEIVDPAVRRAAEEELDACVKDEGMELWMKGPSEGAAAAAAAGDQQTDRSASIDTSVLYRSPAYYPTANAQVDMNHANPHDDRESEMLQAVKVLFGVEVTAK